jgi:ribosomal protein S18 acetylase RimI-like enzyme
MEPRVARPDELAEVVAVCARAFWPDPLLGFFSRGLLHEYRYLPDFFAIDIKDRGHYSRLDVVDHGDRIGAIAMWCPPGSLPRSAREQAVSLLRASRLLLRSNHRVKATRLLTAVEKVHPTTPHWYLALLATDPTAQGRGLASSLLAPVLAQADADGIPAYLETQKASNVAWYARHGFRETGRVELAGCPPVWCLTREPQAG